MSKKVITTAKLQIQEISLWEGIPNESRSTFAIKSEDLPLTHEALGLILEVHPIIVLEPSRTLKAKHHNYRCVAGIRSYLLAKHLLREEKTITVEVKVLPDQDQLALQYFYADYFLTRVLFQIESAKVLGTIFTNTDKKMRHYFSKDEIFKFKQSFADSLGFAKNTLFL
jgi:hypothetical protein